MPYVSWDEDWPLLFLQVHEAEIKQWVSAFFAGRARDVLVIVPQNLSLNARRIEVAMHLMQQINRGSGEIRVVVQPATIPDRARANEWARRHARFTVQDFRAAARKVSRVRN